jgi:hypothetical protein
MSSVTGLPTKCLSGIAAAMLALLCGSMVAKAQYGGYLDSNAEFLAACEGSSQEGQILCLRYMRHAVDSVFGQARAGGWTDFCPPRPLDDDTLRQIIIRFLKTDPTAFMFKPIDSADMALLDASKCK